MAKLSVFAAVLAALIALSAASTYTTTTTVVTTDDEMINPQQQSCEREIQRMRMTHCKQYIQTAGSSYEPSTFLRSAVANSEEEHLEECCDEMRSISSPCRGDALRRMIVEMKEKYGMEMQKTMREKARSLPRKCNLNSQLN